MKLKVYDESENSEIDITVLSLINGVLIGVDESLTEDEELDNYEKIEMRKIVEAGSFDKRRGKKDPEDNIGDAVSTINTAEIERGVDFEDIFERINNFISKKGLCYGDFFSNDEILSEYCEHYDYKLQDFILLFIEHKPEIMTVDFMKKYLKPMVANMQKLKQNFNNGFEGSEYRRIFAYL